MGYGPGPHLVLIPIIGNIALTGIYPRNANDTARSHLIERDLIRVGLSDDPGREEALDKCRHQLGFGVAAQLQQRLDHLGQIGHAPVLVAPLTVHHMEDIGQAGARPVCLHSRPYAGIAGNLPRVVVADVVSHDHAVSVNLHAIENFVAVLIVLPVSNARPANAATHTVRGAYPVSLHQMDPQGIGVDGRGGVSLEHREHIAGHEP